MTLLDLETLKKEWFGIRSKNLNIFKLAFPTHSTDLRLCVCTVKIFRSGTVDCFRQVISLLCMNWLICRIIEETLTSHWTLLTWLNLTMSGTVLTFWNKHMTLLSNDFSVTQLVGHPTSKGEGLTQRLNIEHARVNQLWTAAQISQAKFLRKTQETTAVTQDIWRVHRSRQRNRNIKLILLLVSCSFTVFLGHIRKFI